MAVITDFVHKGRNLSAIVRTCDAVGIGKLYSVISEQEYWAFNGTAKGSHQWVDVERKESFEAAALPLKEQGFSLIAADITESSIDYRDVDYTKPVVLVLGAEKRGISDIARASVDQFVTIPMAGMVESFNVSVAAGIILTEAMYQRQKAGLYKQRRICDEDYQRLFFEWGHPKVRDFCRQKSIAYPPLNKEGEIDNPSAWYAKIRASSDS